MKFCEEIAKGLLAMMAIIVMFSACKRRFILGPGCEGQQVLRGDRERPPDPDGDHRRALYVQAPVGFLDPAAKTEKCYEEIANGRLAKMAILACSLRAGAVGFWDPAAKTNKFGKEIANGRLTTLAVIGMYTAGRRRLASGTRLRRPASFARDRERPPGHDDGHRHVLCVQARLASGTQLQRP
jgi:hypothetical protein